MISTYIINTNVININTAGTYIISTSIACTNTTSANIIYTNASSNNTITSINFICVIGINSIYIGSM